MIPTKRYIDMPTLGIPRESGDDPGHNQVRPQVTTYSPRERG